MALGEFAATAAWTDGLVLSIDDALAEAADTGLPLGRARPDAGLTRREREVASLVSQGLSNRAIAEVLVISERTAETHLERIFTKLDLHSRVQLAAWLLTN